MPALTRPPRPGNGIAAAILAGGQSRRMGQHKALLELDGKPLVEHLAARLKPDAQLVFIAGCPEANLYSRIPLPVVSDMTENIGPLGGIYAAMRYAATRPGTPVTRLLVLPCDGVQLPRIFVSRLAREMDKTRAHLVYARDAEREQQLYCMLDMALMDSLRDFIAQGGRKVIDWFHRHHYAVVDFSADGFVFPNLNTPADWQQFLASHDD